MPRSEYEGVIEKTAGMVQDQTVQRMAKKHGLHVLDVTWEDTARFDDSSVGPNISDMTIQVQHRVSGQSGHQLSCMPVIRYPNFSDVTGDIAMDEFLVLVGNERGGDLTKVSLREVLGDLRRYSILDWHRSAVSASEERSGTRGNRIVVCRKIPATISTRCGP